MTENYRKYVDRMERSLHNKEIILDFIRDDLEVIVDVGASVGFLSTYMAEKFPNKTIIALEPDPDAFYELTRRAQFYDNIECVQAKFDRDFTTQLQHPANYMHASVNHEIYSYNEQFHVGTSLQDRVTHFRNWMQETCAPIAEDSRVIVRDGVRPYGSDKLTIFHPADAEKQALVEEFFQKFGEWNPFIRSEYTQIDDCFLGPAWLINEMKFTITWGQKSMDRECQEHFTILSNNDYEDLLRDAGFQLAHSQAFVQNGYEEYFNKLGVTTSGDHYLMACPFTTQIHVGDKIRGRLARV